MESDRNGKLILSRKEKESILIGDNICVTVVEIYRNRITLSIEAPRDVAVVRDELVAWETTSNE